MKRGGTQCVAYGCKKRRKNIPKDDSDVNRSDSEGSQDEESAAKRRVPRSFHRFPQDLKRSEVWIRNIRRENWKPSRHSLLCSDHFKEEFIDRNDQHIQLRANAVPTRFKKFAKYYKKDTISDIEDSYCIREVLSKCDAKKHISVHEALSCAGHDYIETITVKKRNLYLALSKIRCEALTKDGSETDVAELPNFSTSASFNHREGIVMRLDHCDLEEECLDFPDNKQPEDKGIADSGIKQEYEKGKDFPTMAISLPERMEIEKDESSNSSGVVGTHKSNVMKSLFLMQKDGVLCDFTIVAGSAKTNREFFLKVHRVVLAALSDKIKHHAGDILDAVDSLNILDAARIIEFAYTGEIESISVLSRGDLKILQDAAKFLEIPSCSSYLKSLAKDHDHEFSGTGSDLLPPSLYSIEDGNEYLPSILPGNTIPQSLLGGEMFNGTSSTVLDRSTVLSSTVSMPGLLTPSCSGENTLAAVSEDFTEPHAVSELGAELNLFTSSSPGSGHMGNTTTTLAQLDSSVYYPEQMCSNGPVMVKLWKELGSGTADAENTE